MATPMVIPESPEPQNNLEEDISIRFPLVSKHARNYAAKLIQKAWSRYMMRVVYNYLLQCSHEFEATLNPKELSRIYPEFLESSDPRMTAKLCIRMQGESYPPCLVCRIVTESAPSIDGGKHAPKWIPLFNSGTIVPVDQKALVHIFLEAVHYQRDSQKNEKNSQTIQFDDSITQIQAETPAKQIKQESTPSKQTSKEATSAKQTKKEATPAKTKKEATSTKTKKEATPTKTKKEATPSKQAQKEAAPSETKTENKK